VIPYENFWVLRSTIELLVVLLTAWMVALGLASFAPSLVVLMFVLIATRRVIVIDRQRGVLKIARVFSFGPGPEVALSAIHPTTAYRSAQVNVYQTSGNIRRVIGTKIVQILELDLGPGAPKLQPSTESMTFEVAGLIATAVGKPLTADMQRAVRHQKPRAIVRAALSTIAAVALAGAVFVMAASERAETAAFVLGAPLWVLVAMRWSHALSLALPTTKAARPGAIAAAALAAIVSVAAAFGAHASEASARAEAIASAQRDRVAQQARQDAIPAQRETAPPMAATSLRSRARSIKRSRSAR
jgi:hypothetical protein